MAACDLAIAADSARIGYPEVRHGLVAAIVMHDLSRQIGDRRARQLLLSGDLISSKVAHEWGMVNTITTAERCVKEAIQVAHALAECAPGALAWTKRLLDEATSRPPDLRGAAAVSASVRAPRKHARESWPSSKSARHAGPRLRRLPAIRNKRSIGMSQDSERLNSLDLGSDCRERAGTHGQAVSRSRRTGLSSVETAMVVARVESESQPDRVVVDRPGSRCGEHVGIWSMNVPEWVVTQLAVARIGSVLVNVNPAYRLHELKDALAIADVATLIVGSPFKGSDFVAWSSRFVPRWPPRRLKVGLRPNSPVLKRLIALGKRPGPGWWSWSDLEQLPPYCRCRS